VKYATGGNYPLRFHDAEMADWVVRQDADGTWHLRRDEALADKLSEAFKVIPSRMFYARGLIGEVIKELRGES
jgi:hypothetical protein